MAEWRLGSYLLQRKLGEGGMAQVYLARDVRLGRDVAVKVLDRKLADRPGFRERFMREARLAAALDHPNIVPLYDFGDEEALFLVMPYVSGGSLQDLLPRTPLQAGEVVTYGSQIADALDYAHQHKVVHRDVKPANMLIHSDGRLMLSDFGLAKIVSQTNTLNAPRNRPDAGTPEYMAPEQVVGSSDARSDIYGLGVVLYLLLTGRLPFTGSSSHDVMQAHLRNDPQPLRRYNPAIPPTMEAVVLRAMAKRPADRFQRASELGAALLGALIADNSDSSFSYASRPSLGHSRPTGPAPVIQPIAGQLPPPTASDRPTAAPPWRMGVSNGHRQQTPAPFADTMSAPRVAQWDDAGQPGSITGLLPDLNAPFASFATSQVEANPPNYSNIQYPTAATTTPQTSWNSFTSSQITDAIPGPGLTRNAERMTSRPVSAFQHPSGAAHMQPASPASYGRRSYPGVRGTPAPATRPMISPDAPDLRAALPGSRVTEPPDPPEATERPSRLWIVIAVLLMVMLVAAIALFRYLQVAQAGIIH